MEHSGPKRQFLTSALRALRLILPLGAVVLLSTVFLVSRSIDPQRAIDMADVDITELTREPRIGTARVAGVTRDETVLLIEAAAVRSVSDLDMTGGLHLTLDQPVGEMKFPATRTVWFQAQHGEIEAERDRLHMRGDVMLQTSEGYDLRMPELVSALQTTHVTGIGGVEGAGPPGTLSADRLELRPKSGAENGYLLALKGNVRLIYLPEE